MSHTAQRRFFLFCLPALVALVIPLLACGAGNQTHVPACQNSATGDACRECCSANGYSGNMFNSFSDPPCGCM